MWSKLLQISNGLFPYPDSFHVEQAFPVLYTVFKWTVFNFVQTPMQKLVRRMTRFFSKQSRFEVMQELDRVFSLLGYSWKRSSSHVVRTLDWMALADKCMQAVSHACRHMYTISCLEENASLCWVESTARHTWWDTSDWIAFADKCMQTVAHACRHMYTISRLHENASLRWVESTVRHTRWDTSNWIVFANTCMQIVAHASRHIYTISRLEENASLRWVESTAHHTGWDQIK